MTMADNIPQIIVTVDFGTSSTGQAIIFRDVFIELQLTLWICTGVSWGYAVQPKDQNFTVHQISDWPSSDDEVYKVSLYDAVLIIIIIIIFVLQGQISVKTHVQR